MAQSSNPVMVFGLKFWSMGPGHCALACLDWSLLTMMHYSIITFTTLGFGDVISQASEAPTWVMAEVILGYVMLGGLVPIFSNKFARTS